MRALDCCETKCQTVEIGAGVVARLAILFYRAEQLGHGPVEALLKPRPLQLRPGDPLRGVEDDLLRRQVDPAGTNGPGAADQIGAIRLALAGIAVEENRRLRLLALDRRLRQERRIGFLARAAPRRGVDPQRLLVAQ